ncbi:hypothetical protein F5X99DRAFT_427247 [Biscogniauxia marginata]|nr:hypothetical protein F5X99DRAFT_427247 [Biscogniauxia marginata]
MDTYTPIQLPYFAPAEQLPAPLPTFEEILSSEKIIDGDVDGRRISRVGEHFVVKFGKLVHLKEGENMLFVKSNTSLFVPSVYALYQCENEGVQYKVIVTEYVPGTYLSLMIGDENEEGEFDEDEEGKFDEDEERKIGKEEREAITTQLRAYIDELRRIPPADYFGVLGGRLYCKEFGGPFNSAEAARDSIFRSLVDDFDNGGWGDEHLLRPYKEKRELACSQFSRGHGVSNVPVFSHGELTPGNIIVRPDGTVYLVEWQTAGFYPAEYEHVSAKILDNMLPNPMWAEMIPKFLDCYADNLESFEGLEREYERYRALESNYKRDTVITK